MANYLFRVNYTTEGFKGLLQEGGTSRRAAAEKALASIGGSLEGFYFGLGETDLFILADLPDNIAAAKLSVLTSATGTTSGQTIPLLTAEDLDEVAKKGASYRAPGT